MYFQVSLFFLAYFGYYTESLSLPVTSLPVFMLWSSSQSEFPHISKMPLGGDKAPIEKLWLGEMTFSSHLEMMKNYNV